jgi:hypothetical protein
VGWASCPAAFWSAGDWWEVEEGIVRKKREKRAMVSKEVEAMVLVRMRRMG